MPLSDHVRLSLTTTSVGVARRGFGLPLIVSYTATWVERVRAYSSITGVAADFPTTSAEYRCALAMFTQKNKPRQVLIGRAANKPTQVYVLGVSGLADSTDYSVNVEGEGVTATTVTATSDSDATNDEVVDLLVTALNGVASKNYLAAATGTTGSKVCTVTATIAAWQAATAYAVGKQVTNGGNVYQCITAGTSAGSGGPSTTASDITDNTAHWAFLRAGGASAAWFSLEVVDVNKLSVKQTHADPGIAADLDAIDLELRGGFYALDTNHNSKALVLAAAAWCEAHDKIYLPDVNETEAITVAVGSGTDTLAALKSANYGRVGGVYYPSPARFMTARWYGRMLPTEPGAATWHLKTLNGLDPVNLTTTHRNNINARNANSYEEAVTDSFKTFKGKMADGEYIDSIRGLDWFRDDAQKSLYEALAESERVELSPAGAVKIENALRGSGIRAEQKRIFRAGSFDCTVPDADALSDADKANRDWTGIEFTAKLSNSVHELDVSGQVTN